MLKKSNSEENDNINRKIINVFRIEIQRFSDKNRIIDKKIYFTMIHSQTNIIFSTTQRNYKTKLIFAFIRTANLQNKIDIITTFSD